MPSYEVIKQQDQILGESANILANDKLKRHLHEPRRKLLLLFSELSPKIIAILKFKKVHTNNRKYYNMILLWINGFFLKIFLSLMMHPSNILKLIRIFLILFKA